VGIGMDTESGLVHSAVGAAAKVNDVTQTCTLLHGDHDDGFGVAGWRTSHKREEAQSPQWHSEMEPGKRRLLQPTRRRARLLEQAEIRPRDAYEPHCGRRWRHRSAASWGPAASRCAPCSHSKPQSPLVSRSLNA